MLDECKACGLSRIYWRTFDGGRALYRSKYLKPMGPWDDDNCWNPKSEENKAFFKTFMGVTEEQRLDIFHKLQKLDYSSFDPLAEAVRYGHQIGLQIHGWLSINEDDHGWGLQSEFSKAHPQFYWHKRKGTPYRSQLSFAFPEVRKYKLSLIEELTTNYKLDGLFLDWIRTGDIRDNPQNTPDGEADYGFERGKNLSIQQRAEPQTIFMRQVHKLARKKHLPVAVMIGHPWHYRGKLDKIDGNLRGLLLDVPTWSREGLFDSAVAAGYYRDGGNAEKAWRALREEMGGKRDAWLFGWVPKSVAEFQGDVALVKGLGAKEILFWEADYIEGMAGDLRGAMLREAGTI